MEEKKILKQKRKKQNTAVNRVEEKKTSNSRDEFEANQKAFNQTVEAYGLTNVADEA